MKLKTGDAHMSIYIRNTNAEQIITRYQPWVLPDGEGVTSSSNGKLNDLLQGFRTITLEEMDSVSLLNRVDTKYVIPAGRLPGILELLTQDYQVLVVKGHYFNHYRTLYFDTPHFDLFNLHVNGNAERYKVRSREYIDTHTSFLEVKHKTRNERTIKQRFLTDQPLLNVTGNAEDWLDNNYPYACQELEPKVWNTFTRVTLVRLEHFERVTLDMDINFFNSRRFASLRGIAIAEVKLDVQDRSSPFMIQMRQKHLQPEGFSKYCLGTSMLYDHVKSNALKPKVRWLEKISKEQ